MPLENFLVVEVDDELGTLECPHCETQFTVNREEFKLKKPGSPFRFCPCCCMVSVVPGRKVPRAVTKDNLPYPIP